MNKIWLAGALASILVAPVRADEFADGQKAWEQMHFDQAVAIFSKLAAAGHSQAQQMLGEMYGFGEGVPEDLALAERWLRKSAAAGNAEATVSLATLRQRQARKEEIARAGSGKPTLAYACARPALPEVSHTRQEIKQVRTGYAAWSACFEKFEADFQTATKNAIPADLANVMSLTELQRARAQVDTAYRPLASQAGAESDAVVASYNAWASATQTYVKQYQVELADQVEFDRRNSSAFNSSSMMMRSAGKPYK